MRIDDFLTKRGIKYDLMPHPDTYDAQRMAQALHVSGADVGKTVLLRADGGYAYIVAILPADQRIDFARASKALGGSRLELASEEEIRDRCPDCELGALPPFGSQYGLKTLIDESLSFEEQIVFEGNTHHESIRMNYEDFRELENPLVARITEDD